VTLLVFQVPMSWLKAVAPESIPEFISVTLRVYPSHPMFWLKAEA
jgi:hypothetical protein